MSHLRYALPDPNDLPGWYGKLPGAGDFAHRRLPNRFISVWDRWLQDGFEHLRSSRSDWAQSYLEGHIWFFTLGPSVIGAKPWMGVLIPSVDSVGRYFPLTIAFELVEMPTQVQVTQVSNVPDREVTSARLLMAYANAAISALDMDLDAVRFDSKLIEVTGSERIVEVINIPKAARSLWHTNASFIGSTGFSIGGMPSHAEFSLLFSSADKATQLLESMAQQSVISS
jgi:type VI secretion system protein ImpM